MRERHAAIAASFSRMGFSMIQMLESGSTLLLVHIEKDMGVWWPGVSLVRVRVHIEVGYSKLMYASSWA